MSESLDERRQRHTELAAVPGEPYESEKNAGLFFIGEAIHEHALTLLAIELDRSRTVSREQTVADAVRGLSAGELSLTEFVGLLYPAATIDPSRFDPTPADDTHRIDALLRTGLVTDAEGPIKTRAKLDAWLEDLA